MQPILLAGKSIFITKHMNQATEHTQDHKYFLSDRLKNLLPGKTGDSVVVSVVV